MKGIRATKLRGYVAVTAVFAFCVAGCGKSTTTVVGTPPPPQHIAKIQAVWVEHERQHKKPAASARDPKSYIETMKPEQRERMQLTDKKEVFISPRDHEPYVVQAPRSRLAG